MTRLTVEHITEVMHNLDAQADEHEELPKLLADREIEVDGLVYAAEQAAIRMCLIVDGRDPRTLSRTGLQLVQLTPKASDLLPAFAATFIDAFVVGIDCERKRSE